MPRPSPFRDANGLRWCGDHVRVETTHDDHANIGGTVHGGLLMTMLDSVMGGTVIAGLPEDQVAVTASLTVNFLGAARPGDVLLARASVTRAGRRLAFVDGWITREGSPERLATATGTFAVVARRD